MIVDPRDEQLPDVGIATFEDLETGETVVVDTSDRRVRDFYANAMQRLRGDREQLFKKYSLDACVVRTDGSFVTPMRDLFARRGRRVHTR